LQYNTTQYCIYLTTCVSVILTNIVSIAASWHVIHVTANRGLLV